MGPLYLVRNATIAPAAALVCAPYQKVATTARTSAGTRERAVRFLAIPER
ncbi:hypothetical protein F4556_006628 [Kitasatospora gansuensis]|uniref:Uncharacterized protein n=1 Tax=Kitasatospora gansuensis TaxID=258050 RepID=A0A7W7SIH5_9ACTN|nr:hypothetical protein [Kitasatospora gansuensis]